MKRIVGIFLSALTAVLFFGGCSGDPPDESEIRTLLTGEWVNWLGGENSESIVYIFTETEVVCQHFSDGVLTEQQEGTYIISGMKYISGSWNGTVTAELGEDVCRLSFRTDKDGKHLALGVSWNINSPGYARHSGEAPAGIFYPKVSKFIWHSVLSPYQGAG